MEHPLLDLPVDEVTVMEDRARVVRRAKVTLPAGVSRLRVERVSPVLVDKTLGASVSAGEVRDLRVERRAVLRLEDREEAIRSLDEEIEDTEDAVQRMERRLARIEAALALLGEAGERTIDEVEQDASWAHSDPEGWELRLGGLSVRERALREERLGARRELAERRRDLGRVRQRRQAATKPSDTMRAVLHLEVVLPAANEVEVSVEYLVPNACWRPYHRATLDADEALRFESEGCVWQNTGEDWADARLRFSTQRPSLGAAPPRLDTDRLRVQRKSEVIQVEQRQQSIEQAGLGRGPTRTPELPGIDDGGDVLELRASERSTVPSDGRPHRVGLFAFEAETEAWLFCAPELVAGVLLKTAQSNGGTSPILAGPVDLVKNGGIVGRTAVLFVSPGERFELGWGRDPALRVHRDVEELEPETSLLRNWHSTTKKIVNKLSNLGPRTKHVELVERVPVSELEKVKIEVDDEKTDEGRAPDEDGFVRWMIVLDGLSRRAVELRYTLKRHADVAGL
jgi:uncharacterized protein (TIGR02231 family)